MKIFNDLHMNMAAGSAGSYIFRKILIWIPVIVMYIVIFVFSGQNGEQSGGLSRKVANVVIDMAQDIHIISIEDDEKDVYIEKLQFPIRKTAHMTEYAILGMLVYTALLTDGIAAEIGTLAAVIITFLLACTDEFHQLYVPGRAGKFTDVLIDTTGCIIGMAIYYFIYKGIKSRRAADN